MTGATGHQVREACRNGTWTGSTSALASGYAQANLVVLPRSWAKDFEAYCRLNPKPCPLLEVTTPGQHEPRQLAPGADVRTDLPRYRVFRDGVLAAQPTSIGDVWRNDFVAFLIGCSFTFEMLLLDAGIPVRHIEQRCNVPMYRTNIPTTPAVPFSGPLVVSMRPMAPSEADAATRITASLIDAHGAPIHTGDSNAIGIKDLSAPDYGDPVAIREGEIPVFWACGVTPMEAIVRAKPPLAITHEPGHMFVTDLRIASDEDDRASC